jgi:hypothetical protein
MIVVVLVGRGRSRVVEAVAGARRARCDLADGRAVGLPAREGRPTEARDTPAPS